MIHHISISVKNPQHVANVMAEIMHGRVVPFSPNPGGYMMMVPDEFGTGIEFYPLGSEMIPDAWQGQVGFQINEHPANYTPVHAAISVDLSIEEIQRIGAREGWRVFPCKRGPFEVVEFWIENRLMLELLTPQMSEQYLNAVNPQKLEQMAEAAAGGDARR
ncbi:hypothetical protein G7B40_014280 [Aetokthonos hydrillicola Thurmond2011]|jgi:hypothetical protein|uniref:VOC domain-containing protein n=1 Tax=Aetokthonos hydrillicola Thurmond2011 TaxID=2712845 RepID=A0AAP5I6P4_9CYAN|nr:hypothetical protein [Aetokthonos hydrillicola]MBO3461805.1 hypothetical protein [Aetokthonos hydrillicola CCALA 1050]MBW4589949.1 hypothetical protein [Aetokthonos hydrillicola CCALA 1050]MDR9895724.1 hypothetical protein [Aetokthonos hydrillicola Thurmond2011]